jgi:hypothetical protein
MDSRAKPLVRESEREEKEIVMFCCGGGPEMEEGRRKSETGRVRHPERACPWGSRKFYRFYCEQIQYGEDSGNKCTCETTNSDVRMVFSPSSVNFGRQTITFDSLESLYSRSRPITTPTPPRESVI